MFSKYLTIYLSTVIVMSVLLATLVLRFKLAASRFLIMLVLLLVILPLPIGYFYFIYVDSLPEVSVPNLTGLRLEEAMKRVAVLRLKGRHVGNVYDMKYPEGYVVSQRPEAGRKVKVGRMVNLIASSGKRRVIVPNLLGRPESQAEAVLAAGGLMLGEITRDYTPEIDPDIVLGQNPLPGEEVAVETRVAITISSQQQNETAAVSSEGQSGPVEQPSVTEPEQKGGFRLWW